MNECPLYSDDYSTREQTFCTFRLYAAATDPATVTSLLGIEPTDVQLKGEVRGQRRLGALGWFLSSESRVDSKDCRRHLDWLLDELETGKPALESLRASGSRMDVAIYWLSASGHGGPTLSPHQTGRLAEMGLDCRFDVYFCGEGGTDKKAG